MIRAFQTVILDESDQSDILERLAAEKVERALLLSCH
jgi:hypothetical protein